ncbi:esterase-like activity of phytase family protein [Streptomyces avidinii]|nr:esterase-like activity of phytase family protein [Streptomyces avidinii]
MLAPPAVAAEVPKGSRSCSPYLSVAGYSDALDKTTLDGSLVGGISGLAVDRDGSYLVTDEFAPTVRRYGRDGKVLGTLPVPDALRLAPQGRATANQTFESLTLLPGGRTLVAGVEGPLASDDNELPQQVTRLYRMDVRLPARWNHGLRAYRG